VLAISGSIIIGLSVNSFFLLWASIELRVLIFLMRIVVTGSLEAGPSVLKFFFIQRIGGLLFLVIVVRLSHLRAPFEVSQACSLVLLLKVGGFPFQGWAVDLSASLPWKGLLLLLTAQKFLPLQLFSVVTVKSLVKVCLLAWVVLSVASLLMFHTKKIIVVSSTFSLIGLILLAETSFFKWKLVFGLYTVTLLPVARIRGGDTQASYVAPLGQQGLEGTCWSLVIIYLRGLPPMPGFLLKLEIVLSLVSMSEWLARLLFLGGGVFLLYLYIGLLLKRLNATNWLALNGRHILATGYMLSLGGGGALVLWA